MITVSAVAKLIPRPPALVDRRNTNPSELGAVVKKEQTSMNAYHDAATNELILINPVTPEIYSSMYKVCTIPLSTIS